MYVFVSLPLGSYTVDDKHENPDWWSKKDGLIPYGDPRNELGVAWIPIVNDDCGARVGSAPPAWERTSGGTISTSTITTSRR